MDRRHYPISITVNQRRITEVVIDPHYEVKHSESITDQIVLELVQGLDGGNYIPQKRQGSYEYFARNGLKHGGKSYRLVWLLEEDKMYIGVINAFRSE